MGRNYISGIQAIKVKHVENSMNKEQFMNREINTKNVVKTVFYI